VGFIIGIARFQLAKKSGNLVMFLIAQKCSQTSLKISM